MKQIKKKWRLISLIFLFLSYMVLVVFMHQPLSTFFIVVAVYLTLLILTFLGTCIGFIGLTFHMLSKKEAVGVPFYKLAYKLGSENPTLLASYGLIELRANTPEIALDCFQRGLSSSTSYMTTKTLMSNIAISYWKLGDVDKSIESYYDIIRRFGDEGKDYLENPDYSEDNIESFTEEYHFMYPQDYSTMGYLYLLKKDYEKAIFFTKAAMSKKDNYAAAYDNLGQIAYYQDDMIGAKEHFEKALEVSPKLTDSLYYMGLILSKEGNKKEAKTHLEKALSCKLDGLNTITYDMIKEAINNL